MKKCKKCQIEKSLDQFYKHKGMKSGYLNECKECYKVGCRPCNGIHRRICIICKKEFRTTGGEIKDGGGNCCSRECWFIRHKQIVKERFVNKNYKEKYIQLHLPNYIGSDKFGKIHEHRYIMEQHLGRLLKKEEVVHHINGITDDNRLENLMLFPTSGAHVTFHNLLRWKKYGKNLQ